MKYSTASVLYITSRTDSDWYSVNLVARDSLVRPYDIVIDECTGEVLKNIFGVRTVKVPVLQVKPIILAANSDLINDDLSWFELANAVQLAKSAYEDGDYQAFDTLASEWAKRLEDKSENYVAAELIPIIDASPVPDSEADVDTSPDVIVSHNGFITLVTDDVEEDLTLSYDQAARLLDKLHWALDSVEAAG